jgi:DnaJ-class molecular chaperone
MSDPYQTLGIDKTADADAVKRAYRKLAKQYHPDRNKDDPKAAERFKALNAANDILSDPEKRAAYDRGEIDGDGNPKGFDPRANGFGSRGGFGRGGTSYEFRGAPDDLFSELFGRGAQPGGGFGADPFTPRRPPPKGSDVAYRLAVPFPDAALARPQTITLRSGSTISLSIPPGHDGTKPLRLAGKGEPGPGGPGDALVTIAIQPHRFFTRDGDDIRLDLPVRLDEAVLGAKVRVPTVEGAVMLSIPPGTTSGRVMRLKGRGWIRADRTRGDQLVRVLVDLPAGDAALERFAREYAEQATYDPRAAFDGA